MSGWLNPLRNNSSSTSEKRFSFRKGRDELHNDHNTSNSTEISPSPPSLMKRLSLNFPLRSEEIKNLSEVTSKSNPKYKRQLQKHFKIPPENLIDHFFCAIKQVAMVNGRLFVTTNELCFYSKFQAITFRRVIPLSVITKIEKKNSALIIPDAIEIFTSKDSIFFNKFESQLEAYNSIKLAKTNYNKSQKSDSSNSFTNSPIGKRRSQSIKEDEGIIQKIMSQVDSVKNIKDLLNSEHANYNLNSPQILHHSNSNHNHLNINFDSQSISEPSVLDNELCKYFQISDDERVFEVCYCALKKGIMQKGKLYFTQSFLCFRSIDSISTQKSFTRLQPIMINYKDIVTISLINTSSICSNAITITTPSHTLTFGSFLDRSRIYDSLNKAVNCTKENKIFIPPLMTGNMTSVFKQHFISTNILPPSELPSHWFTCELHDPVIRRGNLFITQSFLCFHGVAYLSEVKEVIHYSTITSIEKKKYSKRDDYGESIRILTSSSKLVLHQFKDVDNVLKTVHDFWNIKESSRDQLNLKFEQSKLPYSLENYYFSFPPSFSTKERIHNLPDFEKLILKSSVDDCNASIYVFPAWSENLGLFENELLQIRLLAEQYTVSSIDLDEGVKIVSSKAYTKKVNQITNSDPSPYICWIVLAQTLQNYQISLAYCRRKFLPPFGDKYQDIVISLNSSKRMNRSEALKVIEEIVDNIAPKISFQLDTSNIQYNLECLCYDYPVLQWCHKNKRFPDIVNDSKLFIKSLFHQLEVSLVIPSIQNLFPEIKSTTEPMNAIRKIENFPERQCEDIDEWSARLSVYLSFGLQYFNEYFDLKKLINSITENQVPDRQLIVIKEAIDYIIHIREGKSGSSVYENIRLEARISKSDFLYSVFSFNERFVKQLLDLHYFRYLIKIDAALYSSFIISLLKNGDSEGLIYSVCTEIASIVLIHANIKTQLIDLSLLSILSVLFSSNSWLIVVGAGKLLVNLSYENEKIKNSLIQLQIIPQIINFISNFSTPIPVLEVSILLLKNCCSTPETRADITMNGGIKALCSILRSRQTQFDHLTVAIISSIWNLTDDGNRSMLVSEGILQTLLQFLKVPQKDLENSIIVKTLGALIALSVNSEKNVLKIGKLGVISKISSILSETSDPQIINNSLYLLILLCSVPENLEIILHEQMVAIIICLSHFGDVKTKSLANDLLQYIDPTIGIR